MFLYSNKMAKIKISIIGITGFMLLLGACHKDKIQSNIDIVGFLAPTAIQKKVAILEDFSGVGCMLSPYAHQVSKAIRDSNPGKFIVMEVHAGSYANLTPGRANFTTAYGSLLVTQAKVSTYPAGTMNRIKCATFGLIPISPGAYALPKGAWGTAANQVFRMDAPVNLGAEAIYDSNGRVLTVVVDLYYTSNQMGQNNLNVVLLQDHLFSKQCMLTGFEKSETIIYEQNNVVRDFITGQWGEVITENKTQGSKLRKIYKYRVPADYNGISAEGGGAVVIDNLKVVAFVAEGQINILNAVEVDVQ